MKTNKLAAKRVYNRSRVFKRAHKLYKEMERTSENWSLCLRKSWHIEKNGDCFTFEQVYNKFYNQILWYVKSKVKNSADCEDITNEVFVKLHKHFDNYDVYQAKIVTWLYTIAQNTIIDFHRVDKSKYQTNVDSFVDDEGKEFFQFTGSDESDTMVESDELSNAILKAFENLKPKYKRIAELYFIKEMQYAEIAEMCNVPMGTVKGMISRCREMLQAQLVNVRIMNKV